MVFMETYFYLFKYPLISGLLIQRGSLPDSSHPSAETQEIAVLGRPSLQQLKLELLMNLPETRGFTDPRSLWFLGPTKQLE